jgi:flagellar biogenesis protein FliO
MISIQNVYPQEAEVKIETEDIEDPEENYILPDTVENINAEAAEITIWDFIRMILILGCVVAAIYFFFYLLKRGAKGNNSENDIIRMLDYKQLNNNKGLYLIEVGTDILLVGSSDNSVNLIQKIEDKESADKIRLELSQVKEPEKRNFSDVLSGFFNPKKKEDNVDETINFMKEQKERIKKLR